LFAHHTLIFLVDTPSLDYHISISEVAYESQIVGIYNQEDGMETTLVVPFSCSKNGPHPHS